METLKAQQAKEPNQEKALKDGDAPNSSSAKNPVEAFHLMKPMRQVMELQTLDNLKLLEDMSLKTLGNLDELFWLEEQE